MHLKLPQKKKVSLLVLCIFALLFIRLLADGLSYLHLLPPVDFGTSYDLMLFFGLLFLAGQRYFTERLTRPPSRTIMKVGLLVLFIATIAFTFYARRHPGLDPRYLRIPIDALYIAGLLFFSLDYKKQAASPHK